SVSVSLLRNNYFKYYLDFTNPKRVKLSYIKHPQKLNSLLAKNERVWVHIPNGINVETKEILSNKISKYSHVKFDFLHADLYYIGTDISQEKLLDEVLNFDISEKDIYISISKAYDLLGDTDKANEVYDLAKNIED
ncbi:MAG: hypothetical protein N2D54_06360, partial [Chloroflexota bacterium]